ncbi:DNA repair and recombination protein RAD54B-like isoform X2 [Daktulosphaira vitifoliae]|uniref:DNA repair and recombination protein RAD54B-like isoform X2 n=1 Tax=Daktulosphaira vitifoliae TaxID=58002 RepID=UPI0021AA186E|nr:DNA repair and recombination protein RAD54B-like isoform X2 [Daktulosphaira vitifoliae]
MRRSHAPSKQFPFVPKEDIDKGVRVVRSPSDILALINSCDDASSRSIPEKIYSIKKNIQELNEHIKSPKSSASTIENLKSQENSSIKVNLIKPSYSNVNLNDPSPTKENLDKLQKLVHNDTKKKLKPLAPRTFKPSVQLSTHVSKPKLSNNDHSSNNEQKNEQGVKYNVTWGKQTQKKHKTWEGDGYLIVDDKVAVLTDLEGRKLGSTSNLKDSDLEDGSIISVGSKLVQVLDLVEKSNSTPSINTIETKCPVPPRKKSKLNLDIAFSPDALIMPEPDIDHQCLFNKYKREVTPVILESFLAKHLRPHQKEGIIFLYSCVIGLKNPDYFGAILADEMGLGKTFQTISLIWMLLKRGPYGEPLVKRVLIVAPSSLVGNWQNEFIRWLGRDRLRLFVIEQKRKPSEFSQLPARNYPVLIISYDMLIRYIEDIEKICFDLMVCDEGHRLKNNTIRTSIALNKLHCKRRVLLTGTPIQNELQEFFALVDFVNPGILGTYSMFKREFEDKIVESQQPGCHPQIMALGRKKVIELNEVTDKFILRRTSDINNKYLTTKYESVVFCSMSLYQSSLYEEAVLYWENRIQEYGMNNISHFSVITTLKKICNHPEIALNDKGSTDITEETMSQHLKKITSSSPSLIESSGKLIVVDSLLKQLHKNGSEKTVLVSYYTQTLDIFVKLCSLRNYKYLRLDGSTLTSQRTDIVKQFNNASSDYTILLLSAKAGGVGLNLIGASRLVLYDSDWNPASDQQAMARIWRDGQKKNVHIYRLLTCGTIEEKIFQRQISKTGLSEAITNPDSHNNTKLSYDQLKDLFNFQKDTLSLTHDLLECDCDGNGQVPNISIEDYNDEKSEAPLRVNQLMQWEHHSTPFCSDILEAMNLSGVSSIIRFLFRHKCN